MPLSLACWVTFYFFESVRTVLNFLSNDEKFFDELDSLARMQVNAAQQLFAILETFPKLESLRHEIEEQREKASELAQGSLAVPDHVFIAPLDRDDVPALIAGMDAVIEAISDLSERFLYPLENLYPNLSAQSRNLLEMAIQVEKIMTRMRQKATLSGLAEDSMKRLRVIEENAKRDRKEFLTEMFRGRRDPIDLIKKKDLHDLLEEAFARMIEVTEVLTRVLLKNA